MSVLLVNTVFLLIAALGCLATGAIILNNPPLNAPPGLMVRMQRYLTANTAETRRNHEFPELELRSYTVAPAQLFNYVEKAVTILGWEIAEADTQHQHMHAVVESVLFKFKDDVEIQLQLGERGTELHIRSASRVGKGDFAANSRHIMDLLETLARIG